MHRKINVLHVCDKFGVAGSSIHGISRLFSWWFPRFDSDRYNLQLVGLRAADEATAALESMGVKATSLDRSKYDITSTVGLARFAWRNHTDILHLHGYAASNLGRLASRFVGARTIVHEHFVDPHVPWVQRPFDYTLSPLTDAGIAVSRSVHEFMVRRRFLPEARVELVYNGAPLAEFKPVALSVVSEERARWGIPVDHRVIGSIGRLDTQKGNRYLLEAAQSLLYQDEKLTVLIVGDGPLLSSLKMLAERIGIAHKVVFTGFQSNTKRLQSMLNVQVFPSLWEGTPLTLLEAMSMGRPIVSTPVDGLGEILIHERNALLVPPGDAAALAIAIKTLLDAPNKARAISVTAQKDSLSFSIDNNVKRIQRIYDALTTAIG